MKPLPLRAVCMYCMGPWACTCFVVRMHIGGRGWGGDRIIFVIKSSCMSCTPMMPEPWQALPVMNRGNPPCPCPHRADDSLLGRGTRELWTDSIPSLGGPGARPLGRGTGAPSTKQPDPRPSPSVVWQLQTGSWGAWDK